MQKQKKISNNQKLFIKLNQFFSAKQFLIDYCLSKDFEPSRIKSVDLSCSNMIIESLEASMKSLIMSFSSLINDEYIIIEGIKFNKKLQENKNYLVDDVKEIFKDFQSKIFPKKSKRKFGRVDSVEGESGENGRDLSLSNLNIEEIQVMGGFDEKALQRIEEKIDIVLQKKPPLPSTKGRTDQSGLPERLKDIEERVILSQDTTKAAILSNIQRVETVMNILSEKIVMAPETVKNSSGDIGSDRFEKLSSKMDTMEIMLKKLLDLKAEDQRDARIQKQSLEKILIHSKSINLTVTKNQNREPGFGFDDQKVAKNVEEKLGSVLDFATEKLIDTFELKLASYMTQIRLGDEGGLEGNQVRGSEVRDFGASKLRISATEDKLVSKKLNFEDKELRTSSPKKRRKRRFKKKRPRNKGETIDSLIKSHQETTDKMKKLNLGHREKAKDKSNSKENSLNIPKDSSIYKEMPGNRPLVRASAQIIKKEEPQNDPEKKSPGLLTPQIRSRRLSVVSRHVSGNKFLNISKVERKENNHGSKQPSLIIRPIGDHDQPQRRPHLPIHRLCIQVLAVLRKRPRAQNNR